MKRVFIIILILTGIGCNRHPDLRCFGASTPTDLYLTNTGRSDICGLIKADLLDGTVIQDEVCLSNQEIKVLCYELEDMLLGEITIKIDDKEVKIKLNPNERNEIDFSTIKISG